MGCVTTVRYFVCLNGVPLESFQPSRGLRQGDPLSPYLFLFVADALSMLLQKGVQDNSIEELKISRHAPGISHLLFADDALLFFKANSEQANKIRALLQRFEEGTGQQLSPAKCSLLTRENIETQQREDIRLILRMEKVHFEAKYLGLSTPDGHQKNERFQPLQERFGKRMTMWSEKHLSSAGKEVLIKSVAQAIPTYIMSVFQLSPTFCEELARGVRKYWWGADNGTRKTHWIMGEVHKVQRPGRFGF